MFFHRKQKTRPDIREIKRVMDAPEETPSMEDFEMPENPPVERPMQNVQKPVFQQKDYSFNEKKNDVAPLFVKIDKYREMLITVQEMKLFLSSAKQILAMLQEIEAVRNDAITIMRSNVQRMEKSIFEMDATLLKPHGVSMAELGIAHDEVAGIDTTLSDLQRQLENIRAELHGQK